MKMATYNAMRSQFETAYDTANGPGTAAALPAGTILAVIQAVLTMLSTGGCGVKPPTPASVKAEAANPHARPFIHFVIHRELVTSIGRAAARRVNSQTVTEAVMSAIASSDEQTMAAAIEESND